MRIVHISDTHGRYPENLPPADVLVHSGDIVLSGDLAEYSSFLRSVSRWAIPQVVVVPGNHDAAIAHQEPLMRAMFRAQGIHLLINESVAIAGVRFWGSPYTPTFGAWDFMADRHRLADIWNQIPDDTDVLITHGPPAGILDETQGWTGGVEHAGCLELSRRVQAIGPRVHLFGHIHEAHGFKTVERTRYYNGALVDDQLFPCYEPHVLEV